MNANITKYLAVLGILAGIPLCAGENRASELASVVVTLRPSASSASWVQCEAPLKGLCECASNNFVSSEPQTFSLKMMHNAFGGYLSNDTVSIHCSAADGQVVTPTLELLESVFGAESIRAYKFKEEKLVAARSLTEGYSTGNANSSLDLQDNERRLIAEALKASNGDKAQAARKLGISERALLRKIKDLHMKFEER